MWTLLLLTARLGAAVVAGCGADRATLEIRNVHIIDPETGGLVRNATIAISNGRICRIGSTSVKRSARSKHVMDGRGRFALPGFTAAAPIGSEMRWVGYGVTELSPQTSLRADQPDADLHEQLARLVERGNTPLQALQAATVKPGAPPVTYGRSSTLVLGSEANFVLLEQDPRVDIANTRSISLVVLHGQPLGLVLLARARAGREIDLQPFSR
ncbi:MAG: hypothetical protein WEE89_13455 [Gemmatimonadota bacterium]